MFFTIKNTRRLSTDQLRADTLMQAYFLIKSYPMHASDLILDQYIQQQYKKDLKNICIDLLLGLTYYKDASGNLILMFKNIEQDKLAKLITYGNGAIRGCQILKIALNTAKET